MCGPKNPCGNYWSTMYINLLMLDDEIVHSIGVTQRGKLTTYNHSHPPEKHDFQKVKEALINPQDNCTPIINIEVQGENKYYGKDVKPNKNSMDRFLKLIENTAYEIIKQEGTLFTLELKNKNYYVCHGCNSYEFNEHRRIDNFLIKSKLFIWDYTITNYGTNNNQTKR